MRQDKLLSKTLQIKNEFYDYKLMIPYCAPSQAASDFSNAVLVGLPSLM